MTSSAAANGINGISSDFEWNQDYEALLEQIATTDQIDIEWVQLRDMLMFKIDKNISEYLDDPPPRRSPPATPSIPPVATPSGDPPPRHSPSATPAIPPVALPSGGLRLPPFPKRLRNPLVNECNSFGAPKSYLTAAECQEQKQSIYGLLHDFDGNAPFTIQRLCELAVQPRKHYKSVGKYLRAVEKTLLVTSTWDAFPIPDDEKPTNNGFGFGPNFVRENSTPLFSPIPFLHDDARRSRSRSPPLSPLELAAKRSLSPNPTDAAFAAAAVQPSDTLHNGPVIGLVDELDDPSPGHMSDHPTALTTVTTSGTQSIIGSLQERFVRGSEEVGDAEKVKIQEKPEQSTGPDKEEDKSKEEDEEMNGKGGKDDQEDHEVEDMVLDESDIDKENKNASESEATS